MISIGDYAKNKGVSYEAVRKQVNRYKKDLEGHIIRQKRTQYLDDEAVAFLDSKRSENPVIVVEQGKDDEIERLTEENKVLLLKVTELQEALLQEKEQVKQLQKDKIELLEAKTAEPESKGFWQRIFRK